MPKSLRVLASAPGDEAELALRGSQRLVRGVDGTLEHTREDDVRKQPGLGNELARPTGFGPAELG